MKLSPPLPTPHSPLPTLWRPYRGEADLPAIADLLNTCEAVDRLEEWTSVDKLRVDLNEPDLDQSRDLRLWEDVSGTLIGFAQMWIPEPDEIQDGFLYFRVLPAARNQGLETEMLTWGAALVRQLGQERGVPAKLRSGANDTSSDRIAFLEGNGFQAVRHFYRMERSLTLPIPAPKLPSGFILRLVNGANEAQAWVDLFNQSFVDHWNHHELKLDDHLYWLNAPTYQPELDLVAIAPDGTLAAFCYSEINPEYNQRTGRKLGHVHLLGTRRGFRRMGLGRAILLESLHRFKAAGMETARLGVDTQNPSGARRLYESIGFSPVKTGIAFEKLV
ncbi:GNAT family N-acetyltransferase [Kovacikia minuta CCNUW1]|uniref:GNAT family N-acetyltransferase n=1 Tax=Kovacikia minuta TaxID=2931930 RepID=UPI001CCB9135|nr:GNAT family N-acetyltransferase [Kovacikia minuta]UBF27369.1 GNAT family N-acetyltransferase [Kovacikia minuta CCNUW1]